MAADPRIETYFAKARHWPDELRALREILRGAGLEETFKWRGPCYVAEGGNIATIWGFRDAPAIGFFKGVLLPDPEGLLQPAGENSRVVRVIRFRDGAEIAARTGALRSLMRCRSPTR